MLDKMKRCPAFDDDSKVILSTIMKRIENLKTWKQSSIKAYFNKNL